MDTEAAPPDSLKPSLPVQTRDPLIRYSVFAALGCAGVCMIFTILYVFSYSLDSTLSFERHFDSYLAAGNAANLPTVLGLHMAQNRMFLQSCGMVAGIFFAFLGLALFLVGIQGSIDATGKVTDYSTSVRRLAPGGVILLASMIFVGVSAMHPIDFELGPVAPATIVAPTIGTAPAAAPVTTQPATTAPATTAPSTQSEVQPAPATPQAAHLAPQSAQIPATQQPTAILQPQTVSQPAPATQASAQPARTTAPAQRPATRLALVNQKSNTPRPPAQHRFQP
jgi:pyruvate/2-oxoglutarate dehydrogenase complex dihydrolipoamide acyltransferase (E2) component